MVRIPRSMKLLAFMSGFAGVPAFFLLAGPAVFEKELRPSREALRQMYESAKPEVVRFLSSIAGEPVPASSRSSTDDKNRNGR